MEFLVILFGIIALLTFVALIVKIFIQTAQVATYSFNYATGYRLKHWWHTNVLPYRIKPTYRDALTRVNYYESLSEENRRLFEKRVQEFISIKKFVSRSKNLIITDEMKALIAASAVKLTFGLPGIYFVHFYRILIYPDNYYSSITRQYHQGEVNRAGIIVLSWTNFERGLQDPADGRNLGLHEMAHALLLEDMIINGEYEFLNRETLRDWDHIANQEIYKIRNGEPTIFRNYGGTNRHEFFAVAVELYFEQPEGLYKYNPKIYATLSNLLNQDILLITKKKGGQQPA